jgi:hypothetical protein
MRSVLLLFALGAAAAGCAPTEPTMVPGRMYERARVGCLDLALSRQARYGTNAPVIEYDLLDSCTHRVPVDLSQLRVVVRGADGAERELAAHDPRHELVPGVLIAARSMRVRIEYGDGGAPPAPGDAVCVDVAGISGAQGLAQWHCLGAAQ